MNDYSGFVWATHGTLKRALIFTVMIVLLVGCAGCRKDGGEDYGGSQVDKWDGEKTPVLHVGVYNYTDYDIGGIFIIPIDKNDIRYAARVSGMSATPHDATSWDGTTGGSPDFAWDMTWKTPKRFKLWWHRVVDKELFEKSGPYPKDGGMFDPYDEYKVRETRPGSAWCEGEIVIDQPPVKRGGYENRYPFLDGSILLHFYPDGHVEGEMDYFVSERETYKVDIDKRHELPVLKDRPCLKQIPNPYYGHKRPISIN